MLVDDKSALMLASELKDFLEYSCSMPTGTTIGKRWIKNNNAYKPFVNGKPLEPDWWLGEYTEHDDPKKVWVKWRKILFV